MDVNNFIITNDRKLIFSAIDAVSRVSITSPFIALVPAFDSKECDQIKTLIMPLMKIGCIEFCCVGSNAELLHDSIDEIIEEQLLEGVITTWHTSNTDACEYFLYAAGGAKTDLLALIAPYASLVELLLSMAEEN